MAENSDNNLVSSRGWSSNGGSRLGFGFLVHDMLSTRTPSMFMLNALVHVRPNRLNSDTSSTSSTTIVRAFDWLLVEIVQ